MMTELLLAWLGTVALVATYGVFYQFRDRWSNVLVEFGAAILWAVFAVSALNVTVPTGTSDPPSEPVMTLVYMGLAFAVVTFLYAIYDLLAGIGAEANQTDPEEFARGP